MTTTQTYRPDVPIYESLEAKLRQQIDNGSLEVGQRLGSVQDLAEKWGVSAGTVRHSLQILSARGLLERRPGKGTFVRGNRERFAGCDDLNMTKSNSMAMLLPDISLPQFSLLARGVEDAAHEKNISLFIASTANDPKRYIDSLERLIREDILGLILVPPYEVPIPLSLLKEIMQRKLPVVTCYRGIPQIGWPIVDKDTEYDIYRTAQHLCKVGKRYIGFVGSHAKLDDRLKLFNLAFYNALIDMQIMPSSDLILFNDADLISKGTVSDASVFEEIIEKWIQSHPEMDAICCAHDFWAAMCIRVLKKLGKSIPDDVAVTGLGNLGSHYGLVQGELTTIGSCHFEIGQKVFEIILNIKEGRNVELINHVRGQSDLIIGLSTTKASL